MTDGLEAARRSEVAKSFRYARAFYDEAEAAGPAEFERNRQAIIDVIALAYRDGRASARAGESALRAAARRLLASATPMEGTDGEWDAAIAQVRAALDGAPWEPSEEQVERVAQAVRKTVLGASPWEVDDWTLVARAALKAAMGIESGSAG